MSSPPSVESLQVPVDNAGDVQYPLPVTCFGGTKTSVEDDYELLETSKPIEDLLLGLWAHTRPGWLQHPWSANCVELPSYGRVTRHLRTRLQRAKPDMETIWADVLWYNPEVKNDCFFDSVAMAIWHKPAGKALRHLTARWWRKKEWATYLQEVAQLDKTSGKEYVQKIAGSHWGGRPEARILTSHFPVEIFAWTNGGRLL